MAEATSQVCRFDAIPIGELTITCLAEEKSLTNETNLDSECGGGARLHAVDVMTDCAYWWSISYSRVDLLVVGWVGRVGEIRVEI